MFLLKLYRFNKLAFFVLISFIIAYIFLNYKWGLVATPIYQFGMYSGIENTQGRYKAYHLTVNEQPLNLNNYAAPQIDAMLMPIKQYTMQQQNNAAVYGTFNNVFSRLGINSLLVENNFINHVTDREFSHWYKKTLSKQLGFKVNSFQISSNNYLWQSDHLLSIDSPKIELANAE